MSSLAPSNLRRIDPRSDLNSIADLIEVCFSHQMDADGRNYLRRLRQAARNGFTSIHTPAGRGFVWVEEERIVGNASLIPYLNQFKPIYLLANVAVHPDFRQRGIGRQLTLAALQAARQADASLWLHVRQDNPPAIHLYQSLGFVERVRRDSWSCERILPLPAPNAEITIRPRHPADWPRQRLWLEETYPPAVRWNLPFQPEELAPDLWHGLLRWLNGQTARQRIAWRAGVMLGSLACEETQGHADVLWPACAPGPDEVPTLLALLHNLAPLRPLAVNYPAGRGEAAWLACGMTLQHTLLWMEASL